MKSEPTPSPAEAQDKDSHPKRVYVGTFNGYRCYIEDPEAVARAIYQAAYQRALEEAEKGGAA